MQAVSYDPAALNRMISVLDSIYDHRIKQPLNQSDSMYYRLVADYYKAIRDADEMGRKRVYHTALLPPEIFWAMDIVPVMYEPAAMSLCNLANTYADGLASAKAYGLAPETCSALRMLAGAALNGWFPRPDAIVWSNMLCDGTAKSGENFCHIWDCPGHFVDAGYRHDDRALGYFVRELRQLIEFLEDLTGHAMDYGRLSESVAHTRELMALQREVEELKKNKPNPLRGRAGMLGHMIGTYLQGTQQAVDFFRLLTEEGKDRVSRGEGALKQEKYRLLLYYEPPVYAWKILDWMDRELNAVIVSEPVFAHWTPGDIDPSRPLEALAIKTFLRPGRTMFGPMEPLVDDIVSAAKEYDVDGVLTFCHIGCRQSSPCNRAIKDRVAEETGLPFCAVETDLGDPSFSSEEEMRDKIEGFLEMIDERRR